MAPMVRRKDPIPPLGHAGLNYTYDVVIVDGSHGEKEGSHPGVHVHSLLPLLQLEHPKTTYVCNV